MGKQRLLRTSSKNEKHKLHNCAWTQNFRRFQDGRNLDTCFWNIISKICNFYILSVEVDCYKMPESNKCSLQLVNCWSTIPFLQIRWVYFCGEIPQRSNICGNVKTTFVILLPLRLLTYINPVLKYFKQRNPGKICNAWYFLYFVTDLVIHPVICNVPI